VVIAIAAFSTALPAQEKIATTFRVKYVAADAVYLEGGSSAGLAEGQQLTIRRKPGDAAGDAERTVAEIQIESVATSSAVGKIISSSGDVIPGDVAFLSAADIDKLKVLQASRNVGKYPQLVTFTELDPLDEEVRENLPKPPLPEVNRMRGRVGFEYGNLQQSGGGTGSSQVGFMLRIDSTRLAGTHWNLSGYYRGRLISERGGTRPQTINDLINRTYHLSFTYDNPGSRWVAGAGRLYIPWASSLSTIDGFYLGRRFGRVTAGMFGGSAPDPTSWTYDARRELGGAFLNFESGSFESFRLTSTSGIALTRIQWRPDRQFAFFENGIFYKRLLSLYSNVEADLLDAGRDSPPGSQPSGQRSVALSRSYLTVRIQPIRVLSFDVSENYFRNIPTFDERLISTGLLDRYLFQGLSGGFRLELPYRIAIYSSIGHSSRTGDTRASRDYLYGVSAGNIWNTGIRADARFSRFDSSFGRGSYSALTLSRNLGESFRFELQAGQQNILSTFTSGDRARFVNGSADWMLGRRYFFALGVTAYRGGTESYNQYFLTLGYRFDNRRQ